MENLRHKVQRILLSLFLAGGCALFRPEICFAGETAETQELSGQIASQEEKAAPLKVGEEGMLPVRGSDIKDGVYSVEVESSSSMFRIVEAQLTAEDGNLSAVITLSGKGYLRLYMGTGEEAVKADASEYIDYVEDAEGRYTYEIPVEALNQELECTAFSKRKEKWYDRILVFDASSLPADALLIELPSGTREELSGGSADSGLEDGVYRIDVTLTGGSGRAGVASPALMTVTDGRAEARIVWSSPNYDYIKTGGETYYPVANEETSVFQIPVAAFDQEIQVTADTTAMSRPHEIEYMLTFHLASAEPEGGGGKTAGPALAIAAAVMICVGYNLYRRKKDQ